MSTKDKSTIRTIVCNFLICSFPSSSLCCILKQKSDHDRVHLLPVLANGVTCSLINGVDHDIGHRIVANLVVSYAHFLELKTPKKVEKH